MSAIDDLRKVSQDLVAPDLKALKKGLQSAEKLAGARHDLVLAELNTFQAIQEARYEAIMRAFDVDRRLERLEQRQASPAQPA